MMNARSDINFFHGSLPLLPPNSTRAIASASNVARVTKLGKGRSFALAARAVSQSDWGIMSFCTRGTEAAPYEESSGEGGQIDRQPRDRQMPHSQ